MYRTAYRLFGSQLIFYQTPESQMIQQKLKHSRKGWVFVRIVGHFRDIKGIVDQIVMRACVDIQVKLEHDKCYHP